MHVQVYARVYTDCMINVHGQTHMYNISLALPTLLRTRNYLVVLAFIASATKSLHVCKRVSNARLVQPIYASYA